MRNRNVHIIDSQMIDINIAEKYRFAPWTTRNIGKTVLGMKNWWEKNNLRLRIKTKLAPTQGNGAREMARRARHGITCEVNVTPRRENDFEGKPWISHREAA